MNIAIIPARGGSRRIPRKNIRIFCGKPIIAYSIEAAMASKLFERVIVSTDSREIAHVAEEYGAEVPFFRPHELADDHVDTLSVIRHAAGWLREQGESVDHLCCIYATAPFLRPAYLKKGFDLLVRGDCSLVLSMTRFDYPVQRAVRIDSKGRVRPMFPGLFKSRSQDLEPAFHDAGQFYWGKPEAFTVEDIALLKDIRALELPGHLVQDIDTPKDWEMAELKFKIIEESEV